MQSNKRQHSVVSSFSYDDSSISKQIMHQIEKLKDLDNASIP
jgi:hypothetical protein